MFSFKQKLVRTNTSLEGMLGVLPRDTPPPTLRLGSVLVEKKGSMTAEDESWTMSMFAQPSCALRSSTPFWEVCRRECSSFECLYNEEGNKNDEGHDDDGL